MTTVSKARYVNGAPSKALIRQCMDARVGLPRFAGLSRIPYSTLAGLMYGPTRQLCPGTAAAIAAAARKVLADVDAALADGTTAPAIGTARRAQALIAVGHTEKHIAPLVPMSPKELQDITGGKIGMVTVRIARGVQAAYDKLWDQPPPSATPGQRQVATKARNRAARKGWPPPMAWDDDDLDDPDAPEPTGWKRSRYTPAVDLAADYAELQARGYTLAGAALRFGMEKKSLDRALRRAAAQLAGEQAA